MEQPDRFFEDVDQSFTLRDHWVASSILLTIVAFVTAIIIWADRSVVEQVVWGIGQIIPSSDVQVVQNLEGGIISEILVAEGELVEKGEVLVRIDSTQAAADFGEAMAQKQGLRAMIARLTAEVEGSPLSFPDDLIVSHPGLVAGETALYEAHNSEVTATIEALKNEVEQRRREIAELRIRTRQLGESRELVEEEIAITEPLLETGAASRVQIVRLRRELAEINGAFNETVAKTRRAEAAVAEAEQRIVEKQNQLRANAITELNEANVRLSAITEKLVKMQDRVVRTDARAPVRGTIKRLLVNTIGGVVRPGMDLVEIVPADDTLLVEARIKPADIAFLNPGQESLVKITAYDFGTYGGLKATLEQISADTILDEREQPYYKIRVRTDRDYLGDPDNALPIIPGMIAEVSIITGETSVLDFILTPFRRIRDNAFRERSRRS